MTDRRPDPPRASEPAPRDEEALLDLLQDELPPGEAARLRGRLEVEPALAAAHETLGRLLAAEREAYESPARRAALEADASRVAAWVRSRDAAAERAAARRRPIPAARQRTWARVLAFSVALHVLVLGLLAFLGEGEPRPEADRVARVSLESGTGFRETEPDYASTDLAVRYQGLALEGPADLSDRVVLAEQDAVADLLPEEDPPVGARPLLDYPVGVVKAMSHRRLATLKRRRLNLLGFDANGTLRAVARGLRYLASRQEDDGSMPSGGGRGRLEQTGLALLAFMADGHCSRDRRESAHGRTVARGVEWLRGQLFEGGRVARVADHPGDELGLATVVLCEDYMLSYGWLSPASAQQRVTEIAGLVTAIRGRGPGGDAQVPPTERPWTVWALDAASRAGVISAAAGDRARFDAWVEAAAAAESALGARSPLGILAVGTALLFEERGTEKPRFMAWGREHGEALVARLDRRGRARGGDPVGDTALVLLALQVAYRTY